MAVHRTVLAQRLHRFIPRSELERLADEAGFGERKRKCPPVTLFWTLVLGATCEAKKTLAGLRRFFQKIAGKTLTSAAFQKRFSKEASTFFESVFRLLLERSVGTGRRLPRKLRRFEDVVSADSTAFALHRKLAKHFRGFKSVGTEAMARITATMSLRSHRLEKATLSAGRRSETRFFRTTKDLRGKLVLFDLGFFSIQRFRALKGVGADFVSRLKDGVNPTVLSVHQGTTGRRKAKGTNFRDLRFRGSWIDMDVVLGSGSQAVELRMVGTFNEESNDYHCYLTTLARDAFGPSDVSEVYRLRWQIELLFRELKDVCNLDHVPTSKKWTARSLIFAALITHLLSRYMAALLMKARPWQYSPQKWTRFLLGHGVTIGRALLRNRMQQLDKILCELKTCASKESLRETTSRSIIYGVVFC